MIISEKAKKLLQESGAVLTDTAIEWPEGTTVVDSTDHGGWGSFSSVTRRLPNGAEIIWTSEEGYLVAKGVVA
jgi:hypothetical protein